ncbi:MAG: glyoxalase superfamily protein [Pseudomonadota bacterium]
MTALTFEAIPILRIGSVDEAKAFYCGYLGFVLDWEHYYEPGAPVYMQVSRNGIRLQLSANARFQFGSAVYIDTTGLRAMHAELTANAGRYSPPAISTSPWNTLQLEMEDPFGNLLRFHEELT